MKGSPAPRAGEAPKDIAVVGAGIIGACCAAYLQRDGHRITLIERDEPAAGASWGNCAGIATGEIVPLSRPGLLPKIPKMLLDPTGPLRLRAAAALSAAPWLLRFVLAGRDARVREISKGLAALTARAYEDFDPILTDADLADLIVREDCIYVYDSAADMAGDSYVWDMRRKMGVVFEELAADDLRDLEPDLAEDFGCGRQLRGWHHVSDPGRLTCGLVERFTARGGTYRKADAKALERDRDGRASLRLSDGSSLAADEIVLAVGPWTRHLVGDLKPARLVESLSGYGVDLPDTGITLKRKVVYPKGGFVITPLADLLRVAGTVEIAGLDPAPDYRRAETILRKARRVLPKLTADAGERWMRQRPFMPDTLPVIDRAPGYENVILATGHGQLGLTLGGVTGRLVADLIAGRTPPLDLEPLSARRFA